MKNKKKKIKRQGSIREKERDEGMVNKEDKKPEREEKKGEGKQG